MANVPAHVTILSSRAQSEITEAWNWYEDRQLGLRDRFLKEITARIEKIEQTPERYPTRFRSYRETPVPVFPFLIIYRINKMKKPHSNCFGISHLFKSQKEILICLSQKRNNSALFRKHCQSPITD